MGNIHPVPSGIWTISSKAYPNQVIDLNLPTGEVTSWEYNGGINQKWRVTASGDSASIQNMATQKYLAPSGGVLRADSAQPYYWTAVIEVQSAGTMRDGNGSAIRIVGNYNGAALVRDGYSLNDDRLWYFK